ncbi:hypothetical protein OTU49_005409 [Cherax quadricarinatus]|uniref:Uncharacterized protein n=1 Tax=Cherax quadricarinatus TaxID=27406 RepID=A0AAW0X6Z0_CHEQU
MTAFSVAARVILKLLSPQLLIPRIMEFPHHLTMTNRPSMRIYLFTGCNRRPIRTLASMLPQFLFMCHNRKTANYGSAQNPTPSSSSSSSSPSSSHYQSQYQTQYQPQHQPHYQRNPPAYKQYPSSSSLKESHPPPSYNSSSRQSYSSSTYPHRLENQSNPATSYPNSQSHSTKAYSQSVNSQSHLPKYPPGVVYADLALSRNGQPNHYRRDLNTEYAILQFNGPIVGQEIDV